MNKLVLITTRRPPDWESWNSLKGGKKPDKARIMMTQAQAMAILEDIAAASNAEDACDLLQSRLSSRKHLSFWLGQIGHRQDVRLGKGREFPEYIKAVVESIRNRERDHEVFSQRKEKKEMAKKDQKPVVVNRKKSRPSSYEHVELLQETRVPMQAESTHSGGNRETDLALNGPEEVETPQTTETSPGDTSSAERPTMSRLQENALKSLLTYADCVVQEDETGIFDVLARNFEDKGLLNFWLWKVGYGHLSKFGRTKDLVDFIRIISREIHRDMKKTIGKPVARW